MKPGVLFYSSRLQTHAPNKDKKIKKDSKTQRENHNTIVENLAEAFTKASNTTHTKITLFLLHGMSEASLKHIYPSGLCAGPSAYRFSGPSTVVKNPVNTNTEALFISPSIKVVWLSVGRPCYVELVLTRAEAGSTLLLLVTVGCFWIFSFLFYVLIYLYINKTIYQNTMMRIIIRAYYYFYYL